MILRNVGRYVAKDTPPCGSQCIGDCHMSVRHLTISGGSARVRECLTTDKCYWAGDMVITQYCVGKGTC